MRQFRSVNELTKTFTRPPYISARQTLNSIVFARPILVHDITLKSIVFARLILVYDITLKSIVIARLIVVHIINLNSIVIARLICRLLLYKILLFNGIFTLCTWSLLISVELSIERLVNKIIFFYLVQIFGLFKFHRSLFLPLIEETISHF